MLTRQEVAEQVSEIIAETIEELSLMTMGYPENRFLPDNETYEDEGSEASILPLLDRWGDRYTCFHREYFQGCQTGRNLKAA